MQLRIYYILVGDFDRSQTYFFQWTHDLRDGDNPKPCVSHLKDHFLKKKRVILGVSD